jgi:tetratricopeptide (TPR) repeat protein
VALVLLLALFAASFPARNTDLWMHLAAGKLLAAGEYRLGSDPFSYTSATSPWINRAWLYDLVSHGLYSLAGGEALVLVKALLIAGLAAILLLWAREQGANAWLAAGPVALAVVAMGPWLGLRPACVSYFFLGLTCFLLSRGQRKMTEGAARGLSPGRLWLRSYGWLLPLFALWANLDAWFLLGPLTVGLEAAGAALNQLTGRNERPATAAGRESRVLPRPAYALGLATVDGTVVCLLNPYHVRAFTLPGQFGLSESARQLGEEFLWAGQARSPLHLEFFQTGLGLSPAGLAYGMLVLLGLGSFALRNAGWDWRAAVLWLTFLLLSALQTQAIALFAVVAGPILAGNLAQGADRLAKIIGNARRPGYLRVMGKPLVLLACLLLVVVAWPGWLMPGRAQPRGWTVEVDPSLGRAAAGLHQWRADGQLTHDERGLNLSPEVGDVLSWFCPEEKAFFDSRLRVDQGAATDLLRVRAFLLRGLDAYPPKADGALEEVRRILRRRQINHLVLWGDELGLLAPASQRLFSDPEEWPVLFLRGRTLIFGWRDPQRKSATDRFAGLVVNLGRRALQPDARDRAPPESEGQDPDPSSWWNTFLVARPAWDSDRDEAAACLLYFDAQKPNYLARREGQRLACQHFRLIAACCPGHACPGCTEVSTFVGGIFPVLFFPAPAGEPDDGPPAPLLLAIRAARRSVHKDPASPTAHMLLGDAYFRLLRATRERQWNKSLRLLAALRMAQAVAAYTRAIRLRPELLDAHRKLAGLYEQLGFHDLSLRHARDFLHYLKAGGPRKGESPDHFDQELARVEKAVQAQRERVAQAIEQYDINALNLRVAPRAKLAQRLGLGAKALDTLLASDISAFGDEGLFSELTLLLLTGDPKVVGDWLEPWHKDALGVVLYQQIRACQAAASGEYAQADREWELLIPPGYHSPMVAKKVLHASEVCGGLLGLGLLDLAPGPRLAVLQALCFADLEIVLRSLQKEAVPWLMRGLLALEVGQIEHARMCFQSCLRLEAGRGGGTRPPPRPRVTGVIAQYWLEQLAQDP